VDVSAILSLCFDDEDSVYGRRVLETVAAGASVVVPAIWPIELANGLLSAERKKRLDHVGLVSFRALLGGLAISVDEPSLARTLGVILPLARKHRLTAYDAAYMELALREQCPIASLDRELVAACLATGMTVV
jgi:predicted nucleic acid-binding protein